MRRYLVVGAALAALAAVATVPLVLSDDGTRVRSAATTFSETGTLSRACHELGEELPPVGTDTSTQTGTGSGTATPDNCAELFEEHCKRAAHLTETETGTGPGSQACHEIAEELEELEGGSGTGSGTGTAS